MSTFRELHAGPTPLLLANAWDRGSARLLAGLGFAALATTSSGHARSRGQLDGTITRDEALDHAADLAAAVAVPISADLEDCFAVEPDGVAETVRRAVATGIAGCSIEDSSRDPATGIHDAGLATERVAAAVEAARASDRDFVLTARAENFLHGRPDLDDTIARLVAYRDAGADVLFAPGVTAADDIRAVVDAVGAPVNVLALPGTPSVAELAELGVRRISVGGAFQLCALGGLVDAARELLERGTYGYWAQVATGRAAADPTYGGRPPGPRLRPRGGG